MAMTLKQENKPIKIKQYIIDDNGRKVAAIIEMEEPLLSLIKSSIPYVEEIAHASI